MTQKFKALIPEKSEGKVYDKNITFSLGGKKQSIYEYTQAGREDTELYSIMEKYGIDVNGATQMASRTPHELYGDASEMKDLRATEDDRIRREQIWNNIPLKIRQQFGNNPDEFIKHGMEWAENQIKQQQQQTTGAAATTTESKGE